MDDTTKARLASNLRDLPKTATLWVTTLISLAASVYVSLPPAQQQQVLALLPVPSWAMPFLAVLLPIAIARIWPQRSLSAPAEPSEPADRSTDKTQPFER